MGPVSLHLEPERSTEIAREAPPERERAGEHLRLAGLANKQWRIAGDERDSPLIDGSRRTGNAGFVGLRRDGARRQQLGGSDLEVDLGNLLDRSGKNATGRL